jgi:hypothetical protein
LTESELGEYLRREGLHEADVRLWRQMAEERSGMRSAFVHRSGIRNRLTRSE